jgi:hypothetical protein
MVLPVGNHEGFINQQTVLEPGPLMHFINTLAPLCVQSPKTFHSISLVCKEWRQIALSEPFRRVLQQLIEAHIFGKKAYQEYFGGDCGPELPIPLGFLLNFKVGKTILTCAPKSLKFTQANGEIAEEPVTLENVDKWVRHPIRGSGKGVYPYSMKNYLSKEPAVNDPHWIYFELQENYSSQMKAVSLHHFPPLTRMSLTDLTLSLLMYRIKTGKEPYLFDSVNIGFSGILPDRGLVVGFDTEGLIVTNYCDEFNPIFIGDHARTYYSQ